MNEQEKIAIEELMAKVRELIQHEKSSNGALVNIVATAVEFGRLSDEVFSLEKYLQKKENINDAKSKEMIEHAGLESFFGLTKPCILSDGRVIYIPIYKNCP